MKGGNFLATSQTIEEYLSYIRVEKGLAANSVQAYRSDLRQFRVFLASEGIEWSQVQPVQITTYLENIERSALAPRTRARKLAALRNFFDYLVEERLSSKTLVPTLLLQNFPRICLKY